VDFFPQRVHIVCLIWWPENSAPGNVPPIDLTDEHFSVNEDSCMAKPFDFGEVKLTSGEEDEAAVRLPDQDTPFRIALLGDFSGRANRGLAEPGTIAKRRAVEVDRDNFDEVLAKIAPEIQLPIGGSEPLRLRFTELDDFHPDRVFGSVAMFRRLREIRARVDDPATFAAAAEELGLSRSESRPQRAPASVIPISVPASKSSSGSLLDDMIEQTEARAPEERSRRAPDDVREFARRAAEPLVVATADSRQAETLKVLDRALSAQMRALLHNADFQAIEAAWRAVFFLVRRLETDSRLKLYLIDITKGELAADLASSPDLRATGMYRLLVEQTVDTPGAEPWAVIAGNYTFTTGRKDAELLARLGKIASAAGAPFVAGANPLIVGCKSLVEARDPRDWKMAEDSEGAAAWAALRGLPEANSIGLALPRFLLRLPYGKKTEPIDAFDFEEMEGAPGHEDYLWANAAFACALLLGQSFSQSGWEMRPGTISGIDGLPLHVYEHDGESDLQPCAEALLTDAAASRIMESGLMPLASYKGKDMVRLVRFQSIAAPVRALAGRWSN
jgi:type VI secretion system protein ImpC